MGIQLKRTKISRFVLKTKSNLNLYDLISPNPTQNGRYYRLDYQVKGSKPELGQLFPIEISPFHLLPDPLGGAPGKVDKSGEVVGEELFGLLFLKSSFVRSNHFLKSCGSANLSDMLFK